jgi:hypothetical protein
MNLYLIEAGDQAEEITFAEVVDAPHPLGAAVRFAQEEVARGDLPADGDWWAIEVFLVTPGDRVRAKKLVGTGAVERRGATGVVIDWEERGQ